MKKWAMIGVLAATAVTGLWGCPGGDDGGGGGASAEIPAVDGLDTDADNQRLRFYVDSSQDAPGLYAFDPTQPEAGGILVDADMSLINPHFALIPAASVDTAGGRVTDYHTEYVYYTVMGTPPADSPMSNPAVYGEQRLVSTDPAKLGEEPAAVSTTTLSAPVLSNAARFRAYDLKNPLDSSLVIQSPVDGWIRVRPSYDATTDPDYFGESVEVISPVWGPQVEDNAGWLVYDTGDDGQGHTGVLQRLDDELAAIGAVHYKDSGELVENVERAQYLQDFGDGAVLVALGIENNEAGQVFLYETTGQDAGTIEALLDAQGEPMLLSFAAMGIDENDQTITPPSPNLTSVTNDAMFFAQGPGLVEQNWTHLYRLDHDGWAAYNHGDDASGGDDSMANIMIKSNLAPFLINVGQDRLFWALGGQDELVDVSSPDPAQWTRTAIDAAGDTAEDTTVFGSANGWVYYNTTSDEAVALNVDTGESVALAGARWIGASSSSQTSTLNGRAEHTQITEVFMLRDTRQIAAVSAASPVDGMVVLGELDQDPDEVRMFGSQPGPHRLAQVEYEDGTFEVVYMNTRQKNSLRPLTPAPVSEWEMPLEGGSSVTVSASATRPLGRF